MPAAPRQESGRQATGARECGPESAPMRVPDADPRARFRDLFAAEWSKLSCLRLFRLPLLLAPVFTACAVWSTCSRVDVIGARGQADLDRVSASFNHGIWAFLMVGAGTIGALSIAGEYANGSIRTTFIAVPDRRRVVLAKATVLAAVTSAVGVVTAAVSFGTSQAVLSGKHLGMSITEPGAARGFAAAALLLPVSAIVGLALGVLLRHPAGALCAVFALSVVLPELVPTDGNRVVAEAAEMMPRNAWTTLVGTDTSGSVPRSWFALLLWPVAVLYAATTVVARRDV